MALARSVNPLLRKAEIADLLRRHATSRPADENVENLGFGVPDADATVQGALGRVAARTIPNRLTPLFSLGSEIDQATLYTIFPQVANGAMFHKLAPFRSVGPPVVGYPAFPGVDCPDGAPCGPEWKPAASVYVFTTDSPPFPGAPELVPLLRLSYDPNRPYRCLEDPPDEIRNRDFAYSAPNGAAAKQDALRFFKEQMVDPDGVGYELDGSEGFIFARCSPLDEYDDTHCIPAGAERLYRMFHTGRHDFAIGPESQVPALHAAGYRFPSGLNKWIGYAYPAVDEVGNPIDSDGDDLLDVAERILGTDPESADTDCDGLSDGDEVLHYYAG
ncbi:MAG: hypothetical protein ACYTG4_16540, partial [Planctomycetota bacterium]